MDSHSRILSIAVIVIEDMVFQFQDIVPFMVASWRNGTELWRVVGQWIVVRCGPSSLGDACRCTSHWLSVICVICGLTLVAGKVSLA